MRDYWSFIARKTRRHKPTGFECGELPKRPKPFQEAVIRWACRIGRCGIFAGTGMGKTTMQICYADQVVKHTNGRALILAPLGVRQQTKREAELCGIDVTICRTQADVRDGINLTNYEMMQHFDLASFSCAVPDESSIAKSFTGKTKQRMVAGFKETPFKAACTATPAPNDHMELGNQSELLSVMPSNEMLSRWFGPDSMHAGNYRLRPHAEHDFWRWMASWCVMFERPSDLGEEFSDAGYILPPLHVHEHIVGDQEEMEPGELSNGQLTIPGFGDLEISATGVHKQLRRTSVARARKVAEIIGSDPGPWLVWCYSDYDADALRAEMPDIVEVRGSQSVDVKEDRLAAFSAGQIRVLCTKPKIAGFGLNWQHCHKVCFIGLSYEFESYYQAIRRTLRFGQLHPVQCHVVMSEDEKTLWNTIQRKASDHERMKAAIRDSMRDLTKKELGKRVMLVEYHPTIPMEIPSWLLST